MFEAYIMSILAVIVAVILIRSAIRTMIFERDNPCGYDDYHDYVIIEEPKRHRRNKNVIYE